MPLEEPLRDKTLCELIESVDVSLSVPDKEDEADITESDEEDETDMAESDKEDETVKSLFFEEDDLTWLVTFEQLVKRADIVIIVIIIEKTFLIVTPH
jgi:hypothetical protein